MTTRSLLCALAVSASCSGFSQVLDRFEPSDPTRSGLVRIYGTGFGSETGSQLLLIPSAKPKPVSFGGPGVRTQTMHIASWRPGLIEAYVPEDSGLGPVAVVLEKQGVRTHLGTLNVKPRPLGGGRLKWSFKAADQYIFAKTAVAADGTVYAVGNYGHLYALTSNGGLKWVLRPPHGVHGTLSVDAQGRIYIGGGGVQAISPDGELLWHYPLLTPLVAGPGVGPDGLIYAVDNSRWSNNVQGLLVLDRDGNLVSNGGRYYERGAGDTPTELAFDNENVYFTSSGSPSNGEAPGMSAVRLGGGARWVNGDSVLIPAAYPTGGAVAFGTSTVDRFNAAGQKLWSRSLWDFGGYQPKKGITISPNGQSAWLASNNRLNALTSTGATAFSVIINETPSDLNVSPNGAMYIMETQPNFGIPAHIRGYSATGQFLWQSEDLPIDTGTTITVWNGITFSASGQSAYFGTAGPITGPDTAHCFVYGMSTQ